MKSLEQLKNELLADGIIDAKEVNELRDFLYADGKSIRKKQNFSYK